ncbi:MAG TPA: acetyl-CoA carboxylase biotin carboxyl carrier protein [Treponema sp.]|nr:acetyl-CoA carboxylase biotin carboxyl carrier protein [Treponema sp.]
MDDKTLLALFDRFDKSSVAEMKYSGNGYSFELRRKEAFVAGTLPSLGTEVKPDFVSGHPSAIISSPAPHSPVGTEDEDADPGNEFIKSPIVGTFYRSPSADAPAFVEAGKKVTAGQKLCIIEAMKMMNALEAELNCEIVKVLVNNGEMVEFDQPLFEVRPL